MACKSNSMVRRKILTRKRTGDHVKGISAARKRYAEVRQGMSIQLLTTLRHLCAFRNGLVIRCSPGLQTEHGFSVLDRTSLAAPSTKALIEAYQPGGEQRLSEAPRPNMFLNRPNFSVRRKAYQIREARGAARPSGHAMIRLGRESVANRFQIGIAPRQIRILPIDLNRQPKSFLSLL
jgi:hypothetical protein